MSDSSPSPDERVAAAARFRATLVRVMAVQVAALVLLWLLQSWYTP